MAEDQNPGERTQGGADAALAATREILAAISQHRGDEKPVFDVILENACRLCNAQTAFVAALDTAETHLVIPAWRGASEDFADGLKEFNHAVTETHLTAVQAMVERRVIRIDDIADTDTYRQGEPVRVFMVDVENIRSLATVPLLSGDRGIGSILLYRREVDPFTDDDIALIEGFAEQAVIAIENARQFREVQRRLERERASAKILEVISRSRDDETPVFDVIVEAASRLCDAPLAYLCVLNEQRTHVSIPALTGARPEFAAALGHFNEPVESDWLFAVKSSVDCEVIRFDDLADSDLYRSGNEYRLKMVDEEGMRSVLSVPVEAGGVGYGCIVLYRREVAPFSDDDVELVRGFASQAVIAIENVRQFREVQARLERERASAEILGVISTSRDDETPVFDVILEQAARLCRSPQAGLIMPNEGRTHVRYTASWGPPTQHFEVGVSEWEIDEPLAITTAIREGRAVNIPDTMIDAATDAANPARLEILEKEGIRSVLAVPLMLKGEAIGCFDVYRTEVDPFSDDDVALMETFAAQAVIAIENVRQFREVQARLERETATKDILRVISQSRDDEAPVFSAILDSAARLCGADSGSLMLINDQRTHTVLKARSGKQWGFKVDLDQWPLDLGHAQTEAARTGEVVHEVDLKDSDLYRAGDETRVMLVDDIGLRTALAVPLLQGDTPIGVIVLHRLDVARAFSDNDIRLVESFAAQAVIAIENVRQFRALQDRLAREAATREVLQVISRSRDDEQPVLEAIARNAGLLCDSPDVGLHLVNEARTHSRIACVWGPDKGVFPTGMAFDLSGTTAMAKALREARTVQIEDFSKDPRYLAREPGPVAKVEEEGVLTFLSVPLVKDGVALGCVNLNRYEVRPFSDAEIELVETFAAQAVIAIENVRQFREVQERLARERASAEILQIISQSRDDEKPVFDAILKNASKLCNAQQAALILGTAEDAFQSLAAHINVAPPAVEMFEAGKMPMEGDVSYAARSIIEARLVAFDDMRDSDLYAAGSPVVQSMVDDSSIRSVLFVPLIKGSAAVGNITLFRHEVDPFDEFEISLVETFAAQAVIAIENVRQFREVQERLERERASADILAAISTSRDDEAPVFAAVLRNARRLCNASTAGLLLGRPDDAHLTLSALDEGDAVPAVTINERIARANSGPMKMDRNVHISAEAICSGEVVHIADLTETESYLSGEPTFRTMVEDMGQRSVLSVPLFDAHGAIGAINLHRRTPGLFSADEVALIETFAAQAVIAIENVHQFREVQTRLERERANAAILDVISQNQADTAPVFDAILGGALKLCSASTASLLLASEERQLLEQVADAGIAPEEGQIMARYAVNLSDEDSSMVQALRRADPVQILDLRDTERYQKTSGLRRAAVDLFGTRTVLQVPLILDGRGIGILCVFRKEVRAFEEDEIQLLRTFAAQAVIAIENVRQFRELQERLERERASAEILEVISKSRDDEKPVFDTILENTAHLCQTDLATFNLMNNEGTHLEYAAHYGRSLHTYEVGVDRWSIDSTLQIAESVREGRIVHNVDLRETQLYMDGDRWRRQLADEEGVRSFLTVPLIAAGGKPIGCIGIYRKEVRAFTDDEIAMVETFAAQAVIAIENVRQFRELQKRLEREAATGEVLGVISTSRDDETPVFDAIIENASRLCKAPIAFLSVANEEHTEVTIPAHLGTRSEFGDILEDFREPITRTELVAIRPIATGETVLEDDIKDDDAYRNGDPRRLQMVDVEGARSVLAVPLIRDEKPIGAIVLYRREVAPFSADDLSLVQNFAAQAVIAIENVRQFREVQERLEREEATREILEVISLSRDNEAPVFEAVLAAAARLCDAPIARLDLANDERTHFHVAAAWGGELRAVSLGDTHSLDLPLIIPTTIREGRSFHIHDLSDTDEYRERVPQRVLLVEGEGIRTYLTVPLISNGVGVGCIVLSKRDVAPFSEDDIRLVHGFAAQAVIAIENVRQFREVQERLEREKATSEVLGVISQSRDDEIPVFDMILDQACAICETPLASIVLGRAGDADQILAATRGGDEEERAGIRAAPRPMDPESSLAAKAIIEKRIIHLADMKDTDFYREGFPVVRQMVDEGGVRSVIFVPLIARDEAIGAIIMFRREVRPFSDDHVSVLNDFAAQAVIAIENVRQFKALETLNAELGDRVQDQVGEIERMGRLKRFLPSAVADAVVTSGDESMLKSHRAMVATLFCDMRGFTAFCEAAEPEETIEVLQTYHQEMSDLIDEYGGGVDQRAGDGIMVIFNDPIPVDDPAGDAVRLAVAMREKMKELCARWKRLGYRLGFGVGVSLGYATVGMVGSAGRFDYTASGTSVNTAARLCDMAADGEVLISPRVWVAVEGDFQAESRGEVEMKGIREPVEVFAVQ